MMNRSLSPIARRAAERLKGAKPAAVEVEIETDGDHEGAALDTLADDIASGDRARIKSALREFMRMCSSEEPGAEGEEY